ncbi:hypothetical protein [Pseudoalteromonas sp.]|uniref:hypothetical protein n=1 Tax=Pseudoalteromonas sp. TaxID=53249 RepID=UPI00260E6705|nr:hypothetical protein [Pseudoalteromonas sp.]MCP3865856.1 hypothetical protein [Aestuariibacter sp.]MCP4237086.1 hypothetical protein [Aestuariibacter sp.]MCP4588919.1 hypothetical protein [Pseudoalteromonas sp.]
MHALIDTQLFMLKELMLTLDLSKTLTLSNWHKALKAKLPSDCISTVVPPAILMKLAESDFTLCDACVDFFSGDFYIKPFAHQQLNHYLPYQLPVDALRMIMVNRHTGTLTILAESAWPLLTVSLFDDFETWSAVINSLSTPNSALPPITNKSLAFDLPAQERLNLDKHHGLLPRLQWLMAHINQPVHRYTVLLTLFPTMSLGTPFFTTKLKALSNAIATSPLFAFDDYNPDVIIKTNAEIMTSGQRKAGHRPLPQ